MSVEFYKNNKHRGENNKAWDLNKKTLLNWNELTFNPKSSNFINCIPNDVIDK